MAEAINEVRMKVLPGGEIRVDTDAFDDVTHMEAEQLIKETFELLGGEVTKAKKDGHKHSHAHTHHHHHNKA